MFPEPSEGLLRTDINVLTLFYHTLDALLYNVGQKYLIWVKSCKTPHHLLSFFFLSMLLSSLYPPIEVTSCKCVIPAHKSFRRMFRTQMFKRLSRGLPSAPASASCFCFSFRIAPVLKVLILYNGTRNVTRVSRMY